jgi:2,3-diaminopropionate biosynthesis protein SbnB
VFEFDLVPGPAVQQILDADRSRVVDIVRQAYLAHHAGDTVNPDSYFLRFPDKPDARIIALPAFLGADVQLAGIKWVSSFPANIARNIPRAAAVLVLNDYETGHPIAMLEGAGISAARTAASAVLAALTLRPGGFAGTTIAVIGAGIIARTVCEYLHETSCEPDRYVVHDIDEASGEALVGYLRDTVGQSASFVADLGPALRADTVIFTTTVATPYVTRPFAPGQVVLNLSLRDIAPEVMLAADNVLDDVEHCLKAVTSPHLAEQATGSREFVTGTLADVLTDTVTPNPDRPVIFSPFGLGALDIAVGAFVLEQARKSGKSRGVAAIFGPARRGCLSKI